MSPMVSPDPTFRAVAVNGHSIPLIPHNCGQLCPSCETPCRIEWEARLPRRYRRRRATAFHADAQGHLW